MADDGIVVSPGHLNAAAEQQQEIEETTEEDAACSGGNNDDEDCIMMVDLDGNNEPSFSSPAPLPSTAESIPVEMHPTTQLGVFQSML